MKLSYLISILFISVSCIASHPTTQPSALQILRQNISVLEPAIITKVNGESEFIINKMPYASPIIADQSWGNPKEHYFYLYEERPTEIASCSKENISFLKQPYSTLHTIKIPSNEQPTNKKDQEVMYAHELTNFGLACRFIKKLIGSGLIFAGSSLGYYAASKIPCSNEDTKNCLKSLGVLVGGVGTASSLPVISRKIS